MLRPSMKALKDILDDETLNLLRDAANTPADPDGVGDERDELRQLVAPAIDKLVRFYFRLEIEGMELIPEGQTLLVMNHDSGTTAFSTLGLMSRLYLEGGEEERFVGLMHDTLFKVPVIGNLMGALGAVRASHQNADEALRRGYKIFVTPGGNLEAFRPFRERFSIKFGGHMGWVRLALRHGVPVTPIVTIGGHETFIVLHDGQPIVQALGLKKIFRLDTFPLFLGLPWGIGVGPLFHLPLPAKCKIKILEPISLEGYSPSDADDPRAVRELYTIMTHKMQRAMDEMAANRRFPFFG